MHLKHVSQQKQKINNSNNYLPKKKTNLVTKNYFSQKKANSEMFPC